MESEAKQSGEGNGMASDATVSSTRQVEKGVDEPKVCSISTKSGAGSESEKTCFPLKILLHLKTPQKKSKDNRQLTQVELVKESKGATLTGWRNGWSGIRSKRKEDNPEIQSLKKAPAMWRSLEQDVTRAENTGEGLCRSCGEGKHQCNTLKQWGQQGGTIDICQENSIVTSTKERNREELALLARTKQCAARTEGVLKSRKYMKMKSWRTAPFMTNSEPQCRQNEAPSEGDPEAIVINTTPISESSDDLDGRAQASKPYSKLSFFRKIRQYNRLRKTTKDLNTNTECESVYEDKSASYDAASEGITVAEAASNFMISANYSCTTHAAKPTAPTARDKAASLADLSTAGPMVSQNDDTAAEGEGPELREDVIAAGLTVDQEIAELIDPMGCQKKVTGAGVMIAQADVSAANVMGTMESQNNVTVAKLMTTPEVVTIPQTAGVMILQRDVDTEKVENIFLAQKDVTASMTRVLIASEEDGLPKEISGSLIIQEDSTAGPVILQSVVTAAKTVSPMTSNVDAPGALLMVPQDLTLGNPTASQADISSTKVSGPLLCQKDALNEKVTDSLVLKENITMTKVSDPTQSGNITLEQVLFPTANEVESVTDLDSGNETSARPQVISGRKHISRGKQAHISPSHSLACDSAQYSPETKREEINNIVTDRFMGAFATNKPNNNCKMLAMYKDVHDMKCPLVSANSESEDNHGCKSLVNSETPPRVNHADRDRDNTSETGKEDSQKESVQDVKTSTCCGLFTDLHLQDNSARVKKRVQYLSHFPTDKAMQEVNVNITQISAISQLSCPEFKGGNKWKNQNGWDAPLLSCVHPSAQENTHKDFAELLVCCGRNDIETPSAHVLPDTSCEHGSVQMLLEESTRQQTESAYEEDMPEDNKNTMSVLSDDKEQTWNFHKILQDSPTSCPSNKINQEEDGMFEGYTTNQNFRPEEKNSSPSRMKSARNIMARTVDVTSLEKNMKSDRGQQNASRQTGPIANEVSDLSMGSHERGKRLLYESAVEIVQTAVQAATGHIAEMQQAQDWNWDFQVS
ncbi:hypothetical protein NDU88_006212 [Pleurodeles waltl]|uniref:Uncharacterized protein n=2 Tax=Pleurodeles waltl TaxID=8319 RepID=A0AAV7N2T0_PLEWA|nr:hypothetical protein NDU88_006212 [Pleurodeles waltl]